MNSIGRFVCFSGSGIHNLSEPALLEYSGFLCKAFLVFVVGLKLPKKANFQDALLFIINERVVFFFWSYAEFILSSNHNDLLTWKMCP